MNASRHNVSEHPPMSESGQTRTSADVCDTTAPPPEADVPGPPRDVAEVPEPTCKEWCALQRLFEDFPVLHDDDEVLCRIFDALDVGDRLAVDEQEVGECAFLNHPELAGIRIALAGQLQ